MSELERVLAELDDLAMSAAVGETCGRAARILREMARDFKRYGDHIAGATRPVYFCNDAECDCGLDAARERWRLNTAP